MDQKSCSVCNQPFTSDRDLQEHQRTAHSSDNEKQSGSGRNYGDQDQDQEKKIA